MGFKIAIIYYSLYGRLVTLANVIAEGARKVRFCEVHAAYCPCNLPQGPNSGSNTFLQSTAHDL